MEKNMNELNDKSLIILCQNKNYFAIETFLKRYDSFLEKIVSSFIEKDNYLFEDMMQEARITLISFIYNYDINKCYSFKFYMKRSVENRIKKLLKKLSSTENIEFINIDKKITNDISLVSLIPDKSISLEDYVMNETFKKSLEEYLLKCDLTFREQLVLTDLYGLNDNKELSVSQISKKYGVSQTRIRNIEKKALIKIRESTVKNELEDYYIR